jgi:hypothetical protein
MSGPLADQNCCEGVTTYLRVTAPSTTQEHATMSDTTSDLPEGGAFDRLKAKAKQVAGDLFDRGDLAAEGTL